VWIVGVVLTMLLTLGLAPNMVGSIQYADYCKSRLRGRSQRAMFQDRKIRTSVGIGRTLLLIATVSFATLKSSARSAAIMPQAANTGATNLRLGQSVQKRLPTIPPIDNERLKAFDDKQSDALKRLNQLADGASLIGDSSARTRLLTRIASLLWPYDETCARMRFKFAFFTVNQTRKLEMLLKNENAIIYGAGG